MQDGLNQWVVLQPGLDKIVVDGCGPVVVQDLLSPLLKKSCALLSPYGWMIAYAVVGMDASDNQCPGSPTAAEPAFEDAAVDKIGVFCVSERRVESNLVLVEKGLSDGQSHHGDPESGLEQQG